MTILVGGTKRFDMDAVGVYAFTGTATVATGSAYRISHGTSYDELTGTFTYDSAGVLIGGTITGFKQVTDGGVEFTAAALSIPVTQFLGYLANSDYSGLFNAIAGDDDKITGTAFNDQLFGAGDDTMAGGAGDDSYSISEAGDQVIEKAGQGLDRVYSYVDGYVLAENAEYLYVLDGASKGTGNSLGNFIGTEGAGANQLDGGLGNDSLDGGDGADTLIGGKGNDTYILTNLTDVLIENIDEGSDLVYAAGSLNDVSLNSLAYANIENLYLQTGLDSKGQGNDLANAIYGVKDAAATYDLEGLAGNDTLSGGQGDDTLDGGTGADVMIGYGGDDTYEVDNAGDKVVEQAGLPGGFDSVTAQIDYVLAANVEELVLGGSAISGTGNGSDNEIYGNAENNKLAGLSGDDYLEGGDGKDTLIGGGGNDFYGFVDADDSIVESAGQGIDTITTELLEFTLDTKALANVENLDFSGGAAKGTGNSLNNFIEGSSGNDTLDGGLGNDTLDGVGGDDNMVGGKGNDVFYVDSIADNVDEQVAGGIDTVYSTAANLTIAAGVENLVLLSGALNGAGNNLANVVTGNDEANDIAGFEGNDTLIGGKGNDALFGGTGANLLIGGDGNDFYYIDDGSSGDKIVETAKPDSGIDRVYASVSVTLAANVEDLYLQGSAAVTGTGNASNNYLGGNTGHNKLSALSGDDSLGGDAGNDTLDGGAGNDSMSGDAGDDSLLGGKGNDQLYGAAGSDTLAGGGGNDLYYLYLGADDQVVEAAGQGVDTIQTDLLDFTLDTVALANVENLNLTSSAASKGTGNGLNNVITGGTGFDTLDGGAGSDTLDGGEGGGQDVLIGGKGNDIYYVDNTKDVATENDGEGTDTVNSAVSKLSLNTASFANVENLVLLAGAVEGEGNSLANIMTGNDQDNTLDGLLGNDTLIGGKGGDIYFVDGASDKIVELADGGYDTVHATSSYTLSANIERLYLRNGAAAAIVATGNAGDNEINGNELANEIFGLGGYDVPRGYGGDDTIDGGAGGSYLNGGDGSDSLIGNGGHDEIDGGTGSDTMIGGGGDDFYFVDSLDDKVIEGAGQGIEDTIYATTAEYTLDTKAAANIEGLRFFNAGPHKGTGNGSNNNLHGNVGNDTLSGGLGNDTLEGDEGADSLVGGKGNDLYFIEDTGDVLTELVDEGKDTVLSFLMDINLNIAPFLSIENLQLAGRSDVHNGHGNTLSNVITGNYVANLIEGNAGNDTLAGGSDNDTLNGDDGNDLLFGDAGKDSLNGGIGIDTMIGGADDDIYIVDSANDKITELGVAGSGYDTVHSSAASYVLSANLEQLILDDGALNGTGNAQDNVIVGNDTANKLLGMAGNDSLYGGLGGDTLDGGAGNDTLNGSDGADALLGGVGDDTLSGDLGADTMAGGTGNDTYYVLESDDKISEAAGQGIDNVIVADDFSYSLTPNLENAEAWSGADITGNDLANVIDGSGNDSDDNLLSGLGGNDTLGGGAGLDTLTGGAGRDHFVFTNIDAAVDRVTDFDAGPLGDALDLSDLLTGYVAGSSDASDFVKFVNAAGDTTVQVDLDGAANGANFVDVCLLQGVTLSNVNQAVTEGNLVLASLE